MNALARVKSKLRRVANDLLFDTPAITRVLNNRNSNVILMYHGIDLDGNNPFNTRHTPLNYFEKQIRFLTRHYHVVPLKEFFEKHSTEWGLCAITFDDGYLNNYTNAVPVLERYSCAATFFITGLNETPFNILWADYVNIGGKLLKEVEIGGEKFVSVNGLFYSPERKKNILEITKHIEPELDYKMKIYEALDKALNFKSQGRHEIYWRLMNDEQIKTLSKNKLFVIGSHGYYHNNLADIRIENARQEILQSKQYLENLIQKPVTTLGYPDGSYSAETVAFAAQQGFIHQTCSEAHARGTTVKEEHLLDRNGIYNCDSAANQLISAINA
jgi:peptidoglycan/xylan/chitin deacetylase (PgdA/CDA1 family)